MPARPHSTIERLSDYPDALPVIARWVWETWPTKTYEQTFESLDDHDGRPSTLIAMLDQRPVGVLGFGLFCRAGDKVDTLWINALYVVEEERSDGLGSRLVNAAVDSVRLHADELYVFTDIAPWYERRGWTIIEVTDEGTVLRRSLEEAARIPRKL
jgi:GNAT superfamily N-acetyltransferase